MSFALCKRIVCLLVFSFYSVSLFAQQESAKEQLKQKLLAIETLSATFTQTVFDRGDIIYEASGQLALAKPQKLRWETAYPEESLMVADGQNIWNIDSFLENVTVFDQSSAIVSNPMVLLTTDDDAIWSKFEIVKATVATALSDAQSSAFIVNALDSNAQIQQLTIYFIEQTIQAIESVDAQGQTSKLVFADTQQNTPLQESLFLVSIPDSYTLDDQR